MGKTRNTGKLATQIQFDNSNNLVIGNSTSSSFNTSGSVNAIGGITGSIFGIGDPTSFSASISSDLVNLENKSASVDISISNINSVTSSNLARLSNLETKSASVDISISNINSVTSSNLARLSNLETKSSSVDISITNINSITSSNIARLSNLETKSASVDISITNINSFTASNNITSLNSKTGSYATTGSNTFFGTQTYSGSVYIANDLIVQGSSSIQYISASSVSIGTNIVQLNTANPSVRFAGLTIIDSGSVGGSGSFLYDSLQDEFIFVHRGNGTNVTSSHFIMGPETFDNLGNETYLTCNILTKGTGKEHLVDSCIFDNGTTTCIKNNLVGTGTMSGTTIYGSTAVCSAVGKFTTCIDAGSGTFSSGVTAASFEVGNGQYYAARRSSGNLLINLLGIESGTDNTRLVSTGDFNIVNGGLSSQFKIASTGIATFAGSVGVGGAPTYPLEVIANIADWGFVTQNNNVNGYGAFIKGGKSDGTTSALQVNNQAGTGLFTIKGSGNIGIGTGTPSSYGGYLNTTLQSTGASGVNLDFKTCAGTREGVLLLASGGEFALIAATAIPLTFRTIDTERMRITACGTVKTQCNQALGALETCGTIANNSCVSLNLNSAGGNGSIGFIAIGAARTDTTACQAVRLFSQSHTNGYNTYTSIQGTNDGGITISDCVASGAQYIYNCSGATANYVVRYINLISLNSIFERQ